MSVEPPPGRAAASGRPTGRAGRARAGAGTGDWGAWRSRRGRHDPRRYLLGAPLWFIVGICSVLPLLWVGWQVVSHPGSLVELRLDTFRARLLGRTVLYNGSVAMIAVILSIPAAIALGRGRGWAARALWVVVPAALLLPSITYAYGWSQFVRLLGLRLEPAGAGDVFRCIWTLATWLWGLAAVTIGLSLRSVDTQVQQQAMLDGAYWRITARQVAPAALGALCIVAVLAMQEFSVYEPTGISVVATEVRMVFDTGAFSSSTNQMNIPSGLGVRGTDGAVAGGAGGSLFGQMGELSTQSQRSAAAVVAATPMLALIVVLALVAAAGARRLGSAESIDPGQWPAVLDAGKTVTVVAWLIVALALVVPTIALVVSLKRPFSFWRTYMAFSPQVMGSLGVAAIAGAVALGIGLWAAVASDRWLVPLSLLSFLVGGQLLAIAQIRLYNRPWLERWVYDGPIVVVMAYLARFGWVALLGGRATWTRPWRQLRELAAIDGAGPMATARRVVWPLVWPVCVAAGVLVMVLSLSEVPATVLLSPVRPPMLVPMLMTWVHTLRSDDMIEGSLLMMSLAGGLGVIGVGIGWIGMSMLRRVGRRGGMR